MNDQDFAIVVGIQDYPQYGSLQGAVADARAFAAWLTEEPEGGRLPEKNCHLITSTPAPLVPEAYQIDDAWDSIHKASAGGARRLYFYFSGHGMASNLDNCGLCLPKWSESRNGAAFRYEAFRRCIRESGRFREAIFLLDCCRVWHVAVRGKEPDVCMPAPAENTGETEFAELYGAEIGGQAREAAARKQLVRGNFSRALLEALRGGAARPEGGVYLQDLLEAVEVRTYEIAKANKQEQKADNNVHPRKANWLFGTARPFTEVEIEVEAKHTGDVVLYDADNAPVGRGTAAGGRWKVRLAAGRHALVDELTGEERFFYVAPGEERHERF